MRLKLLSPLFFLIVLFIYSCQNNSQENIFPTSPIEKAKAFFDSELSDNKAGNKNGILPVTGRMLDWEKAREVTLNTHGQAVQIPIIYDKNYNLLIKPGRKAGLQKHTSLFIFKDADSVYHGEVISWLPDVTPHSVGKFTGIIIVESWSGEFLKGYMVTDSSSRRVSMRMVEKNPAMELASTFCYWMDWEQCVYYGGETVGCTILYSTWICENISDTDDDNGEFPTEPDGPIDGGGGGGGGGTPTSGNPDNRINVVADMGRLSCESFQFKKISSTANSQEAGVSGLRFVIDWVGGVPAKAFPFRTIYVSVGVKQANGNNRSPASAAIAAAKAANAAGMRLAAFYAGISPALLASITTSQIENEFKVFMEEALIAEVQGYGAVLFSPTGNSTTVKAAVWNSRLTQLYNGLTGYDCED